MPSKLVYTCPGASLTCTRPWYKVTCVQHVALQRWTRYHRYCWRFHDRSYQLSNSITSYVHLLPVLYLHSQVSVSVATNSTWNLISPRTIKTFRYYHNMKRTRRATAEISSSFYGTFSLRGIRTATSRQLGTSWIWEIMRRLLKSWEDCWRHQEIAEVSENYHLVWSLGLWRIHIFQWLSTRGMYTTGGMLGISTWTASWTELYEIF